MTSSLPVFPDIEVALLLDRMIDLALTCFCLQTKTSDVHIRPIDICRICAVNKSARQSESDPHGYQCIITVTRPG